MDARQPLLTFRIANEWYALPVGLVRRVETRPNLTPVPGAPSGIPGVFHSQGELFAAVDLRTLFGLTSESNEEPVFVIIVQDEGDQSAGLLADWVDEVVPVSEATLEAPAPSPGAQWCRGQVHLRDRVAALIDLSALFAGISGEQRITSATSVADRSDGRPPGSPVG